MKKFEYCVLNVGGKGFWNPSLNYEQLTEKLNALGQQGWEVVTNTPSNIYEGYRKTFLIILKREIINH